MKNECPMRRVKCKHCNAEVVQQDLDTVSCTKKENYISCQDEEF